MALANNPTLVQASAQLDGNVALPISRLWLNPVVGYQSEQIGVKGASGHTTAGETQGGFVSQSSSPAESSV